MCTFIQLPNKCDVKGLRDLMKNQLGITILLENPHEIGWEGDTGKAVLGWLAQHGFTERGEGELCFCADLDSRQRRYLEFMGVCDLARISGSLSTYYFAVPAHKCGEVIIWMRNEEGIEFSFVEE